MRRLLTIIALLVFSLAKGQAEFSTLKHDFGNLDAIKPRFVDIQVSNNSSKEFIIFSVRKPREVQSLTSNKFVKPDSTSTIRFQVNPKSTGQFDYKVEVFTSNQNEAHVVHLKGNVVELSANEMQLDIPCPGFGSTPPGTNPFQFKLTVVTVDKASQEELKNSNVTFIQKGQLVWEKQTDIRGEIATPAQLGLSYFQATHDGYLPAEKGEYINFKRNVVVLELEKDTTKKLLNHVDAIIDLEAIDTVVWERFEMENLETQNQSLEEIAAILKDSTIADQFDSVLHVLSALDPENFEDKYFKPVNVVFILDISSSMKHADRIELMKYSLMQLADMLRPQDKFGIITYASGVNVLLNPTSGENKEILKEKIAGLNAGGFTSGGLGIKLGFKTAKSSQIDDGANHVIIITDGGFNRDSDNYKRVIKKYKKKGITFSVVGIKNNPKVEVEMKAAAELGGGRYIPIRKLDDAKHKLKQEIRQRAYRY